MARIDLSLVSSSSGVFPSRSRWRAAGQRDGRIEVPRSGLLGGVVLPIHMTSSAAVLDEVTRVLSAKLRSGAGERVLLEEIALRDPVMPVPDGLIG